MRIVLYICTGNIAKLIKRYIMKYHSIRFSEQEILCLIDSLRYVKDCVQNLDDFPSQKCVIRFSRLLFKLEKFL